MFKQKPTRISITILFIMAQIGKNSSVLRWVNGKLIVVYPNDGIIKENKLQIHAMIGFDSQRHYAG